MHRFVLHNDEVVDATRKCASAGQTGLMNGWGIFTTIRVCQGILFAWERHWVRMQRDARKLHVGFPDSEKWMLERLERLIEANHAGNATLRIAVVRNRGGSFEGPDMARDFDLFAFTADLTNWGEAAKLGVKANARHAACEFAGTKVTSWAFNLTWYEEAHERGFDEYVLLNDHGDVCECTSANIFAAYDNQVWTPPLSSGCLPGITRELLLGDASVPGIRVGEKTLSLADLELADRVFMTSSTRDIMPISFIEGLTVGRNGSVATALGNALTGYRRQYVERMASAK